MRPNRGFQGVRNFHHSRGTDLAPPVCIAVLRSVNGRVTSREPHIGHLRRLSKRRKVPFRRPHPFFISGLVRQSALVRLAHAPGPAGGLQEAQQKQGVRLTRPPWPASPKWKAAGGEPGGSHASAIVSGGWGTTTALCWLYRD